VQPESTGSFHHSSERPSPSLCYGSGSGQEGKTEFFLYLYRPTLRIWQKLRTNFTMKKQPEHWNARTQLTGDKTDKINTCQMIHACRVLQARSTWGNWRQNTVLPGHHTAEGMRARLWVSRARLGQAHTVREHSSSKRVSSVAVPGRHPGHQQLQPHAGESAPCCPVH